METTETTSAQRASASRKERAAFDLDMIGTQAPAGRKRAESPAHLASIERVDGKVRVTFEFEESEFRPSMDKRRDQTVLIAGTGTSLALGQVIENDAERAEICGGKFATRSHQRFVLKFEAYYHIKDLVTY